MDKAAIVELLLKNDHAVERAILAIYARQTAEEQATKTTRKSNGQGFNAFDANNGSYFAEWIKSGRRLSGRFLASARKLSIKYAGQLEEVAAAKSARKLQGAD